jgi:hypothetical protein
LTGLDHPVLQIKTKNLNKTQCRLFFIVMLSVFILNVIMLSVDVMNVVMLSAVTPTLQLILERQ